MAEITFRFPCVFGGRVSFPCGEVLSSARGALVGYDGFDFVLFFRSDQSRQRGGVAGAMRVCLFEWGKKACMENIMDFPCGREFEAIHEWR